MPERLTMIRLTAEALLAAAVRRPPVLTLVELPAVLSAYGDGLADVRRAYLDNRGGARPQPQSVLAEDRLLREANAPDRDLAVSDAALALGALRYALGWADGLATVRALERARAQALGPFVAAETAGPTFADNLVCALKGQVTP
jgi:hypothetical protein